MIYLCDMKALYKIDLHLHYAHAVGFFIEEKEKADWLLKTKPKIYFGEISGKRSSVSRTLDEDDIQMITDDPDDLKVIERLDLEHGINPFWYPAGEFEFVNEAYDGFIQRSISSSVHPGS